MTIHTIFKLAQTLGLSQHEIESLLTRGQNTEQPTVSLGPRQYPGGYYGVVSIRDFGLDGD